MNDQIKQKLKPCPFCGGIAIVDMDEDWYWEWKVFCPKCGCDIGYFKTKEEAIKAWNKRADQPPAVGIDKQTLIEEVKKALNRDSIGLNDKWNLAIARVIKIIESQPPADVPETNVGEITLKQAIEAVKALKGYCGQISVDTCLNGHCPIGAWCFNDRKSEPTPATWKIPQERTEE